MLLKAGRMKFTRDMGGFAYRPNMPGWLLPRPTDHGHGPLAMVVEQAGGAASTGTQRILVIEPTSLHQKVPLIIGSKEDVAEYEKYYKAAAAHAAD